MSGEQLNSAVAGPDPGLVLAQTREELGITQREVSDALNLPVSTVAAIEAGDKARLPAHVFTRGYVRAYAKLLELDPDPLVAALSTEHSYDSSGARSMPNNNGVFPPGLDLTHLLRPRNLAVGAGVLLIIIVLLILLISGDETQGSKRSLSEPAERQAPAGNGQTDALTSGNMQKGIPQAVSDPSSLPAHDIEAPEHSSSAAGEYETPVTEAGQFGVRGEPVGQSERRRLSPYGEDRLDLQFTEDCWVEIKDSEDNVLFGDLGRVGQSFEFIGSGPFAVLLGYAPGVRLRFNGENIALAPHTRNNVATLVIGQ